MCIPVGREMNQFSNVVDTAMRNHPLQALTLHAAYGVTKLNSPPHPSPSRLMMFSIMLRV